MVLQGLGGQEAETIWRPFFDWVAASPGDFPHSVGARIVGAGAVFLGPASDQLTPGVVLSDDRPGAPEDNIFWTGNLGEAGIFWHGYQSAWLPASLLQADQREKLADALFAAAKHRGVSLHVNKGLAGATADAIEAAGIRR